MTEFTHIIKTIIIGDSSVGKSSFMRRFTYNDFSYEFMTTIGVDFGSKIIINNNKKIKIQIWDTGGQEKFRAITSNYYKGSTACIIMFDLTDPESFNNISMWYNTVTNANESCYKILVGTKSDLNDKRCISYDQINDIVKKLNIDYIEVSSKNGTNIDSVFKNICNKAQTKNSLDQNTIKLTLDKNNNKSYDGLLSYFNMCRIF